jgi:hypothetical protein
MFLRIATLLALALAAGLIAAGCGDDDDDTATTASTTTVSTGATGATGAATGEPLTKDEFIAQADAVCKAGDKKIDAAAKETFSGGGQPSQADQEAFVTDDVIPNVQDEVDGIAALTPPEGDEDEVSAIVDSAQDAIDQIESDPSALTEGASADDPFAEANQLAKEYGLKVCGQS